MTIKKASTNGWYEAYGHYDGLFFHTYGRSNLEALERLFLDIAWTN